MKAGKKVLGLFLLFFFISLLFWKEDVKLILYNWGSIWGDFFTGIELELIFLILFFIFELGIFGRKKSLFEFLFDILGDVFNVLISELILLILNLSILSNFFFIWNLVKLEFLLNFFLLFKLFI